MNTYTGIIFDPTKPVEEGINIVDIAHSLSNICRANGHLKYFYSVAQHCVCCANEALARGYGKKVAFACLLHDASEAYIADVIRPVKSHFEQYGEIEKKLQKVIYAKFGLGDLTHEELAKIAEIDDDMLYNEFAIIGGQKLIEETPQLFGVHDFSEQIHSAAQKLYIVTFQELAQFYE